jgi:hypothetical protein
MGPLQWLQIPVQHEFLVTGLLNSSENPCCLPNDTHFDLTRINHSTHRGAIGAFFSAAR